MKNLTKSKDVLHKRNAHKDLYDFELLSKSEPSLKEFVKKNKYDNLSIDFSNSKAVLALNKALLSYFYEIKNWSLAENYLCPAIPGRADYIHYLADLLASSNNNKIPRGSNIKVLDIGIGANCIYSLLGARIYDWNFIGSEVNEEALNSANNIISSNENIKNKIKTILQNDSNKILKNIIKEDDYFDLTLCNPPFHKSQEEASEQSNKKIKNLNKNLSSTQRKNSLLNFQGQAEELWCKGGELEFISKMIRESIEYKKNCLYFTSLVSKSENLPRLYALLKKVNAVDVKTIQMAQGQKISRFIVWSFLSKKQQQTWSLNRD